MFDALGTFIVPVHLYGVLLALAYLTGIASGLWHGRRLGFASDDILDLAVWFLASSILGARLLYIFLYPDQFPTWISYLALHQGGLVFFGGFVATAVTVVMYGRYRHWSLRDLGDMIAPSLAFAHVVGRIGCFTNGCCYGRQTDSVLGVVFPNLADGIARHPTQLYEALVLLVLGGGASYLIRRRATKPGAVFPGLVWGLYMSLYGLFRFLIEFLRGDDRGGFFTPLELSISQCLGLVALFIGIVWIYGCRRQSIRESQVTGETG